MGLKWILNYCPKADLIVKVDDDIIVNVFRLAAFFKEMRDAGKLHHLLYCRNYGHEKQVSRTGKWAITKEQYAPDVYPDYCQGLGYALTLDYAAIIYETSLYTPFLEIEDAYVTGVVVEKTNITFTPFDKRSGYSYLNVDWKTSSFEQIAGKIMNKIFVLFRANNPEFFSEFWPTIWNTYVNEYIAKRYAYA